MNDDGISLDEYITHLTALSLHTGKAPTEIAAWAVGGRSHPLGGLQPELAILVEHEVQRIRASGEPWPALCGEIPVNFLPRA